MAKIAIKSEKITPFGGIFHVMDQFSSVLEPVIDEVLGRRSKLVGYQYGEIIRSLMCVYFCGGSCIEDVSSHLMRHLSLHPYYRTCSSDTILRAICELTGSNTTYVSDSGKSYGFNTAPPLNKLLVRTLLATGQLKSGETYDFDFDHQFIQTEKYDAKMTYKHFTGYSPGIAFIGDCIVGIENRDGNANVRFHQSHTLERIYTNIEGHGMTIDRSRMDCGSCSKEIVETVEKHSKHFYIRANNCASLYDKLFALRGWTRFEDGGNVSELNSIMIEKWVGKVYRLVIQRQRRTDGESDLWEGEYTYRCILTNDYESTNDEIVRYYNLRGGKERHLDEMNNGFGWNRLPKSFMAENTVFLILTAIIRNFYLWLMSRLRHKEFGLSPRKRIKAFVFKFICVPAKWIWTARQWMMNIYTQNTAYRNPFCCNDS